MREYFGAFWLAAASLLVAVPAAADTIYVANNCSGEPTPCTTDFQGALDDTRYTTVQLQSQTTVSGDFLIDRSLTLTSETDTLIQTSSVFALRVEDTSTVLIERVSIEGRLAISDSSGVTVSDANVRVTDLGVQINNSDDVTLDAVYVDATDRAVDARDSNNLDIVLGCTLLSDDYAVVLSSTAAEIDDADLDGATHAVVLQDGSESLRPSGTFTDVTVASGSETTWRWEDASTSYTNVSPTPTESVSTSSNLVSLIGYTPWPTD